MQPYPHKVHEATSEPLIGWKEECRRLLFLYGFLAGVLWMFVGLNDGSGFIRPLPAALVMALGPLVPGFEMWGIQAGIAAAWLLVMAACIAGRQHILCLVASRVLVALWVMTGLVLVLGQIY